MSEITAKVVCDSVSPAGSRLTTFELVYPRYLLAEFNTHRVLSRNTASSRAIPTSKILGRADYMPKTWDENQRGMSSSKPIDPEKGEEATKIWERAREFAKESATGLAALGVHKQLVNRILEPFLFVTTLVTATEWDNFFHLRTLSAGAQPDFAELTDKMLESYNSSVPTHRSMGDWHMPLTEDLTHKEKSRVVQLGISLSDRPSVPAGCLISVARCSRVSVLNHDGSRDLQVDIDHALDMLSKGHLSPFEHVALPQKGSIPCFQGNFYGWTQLRKMIPHEWDILGKGEYHHA